MLARRSWLQQGRPLAVSLSTAGFFVGGSRTGSWESKQLCKNAMHRWNGASACESLGQSIISVAVTMTEAPSDSYLYI